MKDLEELSTQTCNLLSVTQLKAICRRRGFNPPSGPKEMLASFVAPRLLESTGVEKAMASLEEKWLMLLHRIAMSQSAPGLYDLRLDVPSYEIDYRALFRKFAENLINRGVVLVEDPPRYGIRGLSRFERCTFHLAESHRSLLPPFPVPTQPLGQSPEVGNHHSFCVKALQAAVQRESASGAAAPTGLLGRVADRIVFEEGRLRFGKSVVLDWATFSRQVHGQWAEGPRGSGKAKPAGEAFRAVEWILSHLPAGKGTMVADLERAVAQLYLARNTLGGDQLSQFCDDGYAAGLLWRSTDKCYAVQPQRDVDADRPLVFSPTKEGIAVDLNHSGLSRLLELATVSCVRAVKGKLHLVPDVLLLGRAAPRLKTLAALGEVRSASAPFDEAVRYVEQNVGSLLLHQGLVVFRIEDLGFRTLLAHQLSGIRALGGPYLAAPRGLVMHVEELARKEGFAPRRIS